MVSVMLKQILLNKNCRKLVFKMTTYLEKEHINQKLYQNFGFKSPAKPEIFMEINHPHIYIK